MNNTFVIVTWNNEKQILKLLNSIKVFETDSQIIVVDNNSEDRTVEVINQKRFSNIEIIRSNKNLGFAKANNLAIKKVKTKYVTFINPDTKLKSPIVEPFTKSLTNGIGIIGPKILNLDGSLQPSIFSFQCPSTILIEQFGLGRFLPDNLKLKFSPQDSSHNHKQNVEWLIGACLFTKTDYYKNVGGFSEDYFLYSEDMDLCYKYHRDGMNVLFDPNIEILHIGGSSEGQTSTAKSLKLLKSFCIFAHKYDLDRNIPTLYYSYLIKYLLFLPLDKERANRYKNNFEYLRGELK